MSTEESSTPTNVCQTSTTTGSCDLGVPYNAFIQRDSCPSHHEVGGLFFDFEAIRCSAQVTSLEVRGKQPEEMTKLMLCDLLHRDIMLEKRVLGERAHRRIHELEEEIRELKKVRRVALAKRLVVDITKMWAPLREIQAEEDARDRQKKQTEVVENIALTQRPFL